MKAIIVGAGGATRELLRRLGEAWELVVVETDRSRLDSARAIRPFKAVLGDGSSRLVLERSGLAEAEAVIAATNDDDVNLEVCRLARERDIIRITAVAADPERVADYEEIGVEAFSHDTVVARRLEEHLISRHITSQSFAQGRAEVIEFEVAHGSPVRGRSLGELRPKSWVVGAILRKGKLLIPHGETVFQEGDRVTVVGAGAEFSAIVRTFTKGETHFPIDYGKTVAVALDERNLKLILPEATYLVKNSRATSLLIAHRRPASVRDEEERKHLLHLLDQARKVTGVVEARFREVDNDPLKALPDLPESESVGVLARIAPGRGLRSLWTAAKFVRLARSSGRPVLLGRGTFPYRRILVPARNTKAGLTASRAAIDLAVQSKAHVVALAAQDPYFMSGSDQNADAQEAVAFLREEAALLGLNLEGRIERANPVRIFLQEARRSDLLVLGVGSAGRSRFQLGVVHHLACRSSCSVLLTPIAPDQTEDG